LPSLSTTNCPARGALSASRSVSLSRLDTLIARHGAEACVRVIVPELIAHCPQRDSVALMERCDILFPELLTLFPAR
jgi:hypothetical protein